MSLTHCPSKIVRQLMIDLSLGTIPSDNGAWPIFVAWEPNTPDSLITIHDTEPNIDGRRCISGVTDLHLGIQIAVRSLGYEAVEAKATSIMETLEESVSRASVTIDTSNYVVYAIFRNSGPLSLGLENPTSKRYLFTLNAFISVRQTT